jgi:NAD(P)-dependent dehydrogenase (short-subunit alcohol dehydrogenase family)
LTDQAELEGLIPAITARFGQPNILINSASIYRTAPLADTTRAEWDENMAVHAWAPLRLSQILLQGLGSSPGKIINMNDAHPTRPNRFAYGVSKSALSAVTRTLAAAAGPYVQVNELALGAILPPPGLSPDRVDAIIERVPAQRWGSAEEIVSVVLSLIENDYINGERIHVDGGEMGGRW